MICEYTNKMLMFVSYVFDGNTDPSNIESNLIEDKYSVSDVLAHFIMAIITLVFLAWWVIPLRKLGVYDIEFTCDKKE